MASAFLKVGLLFHDTDDDYKMEDGNRLIKMQSMSFSILIRVTTSDTVFGCGECLLIQNPFFLKKRHMSLFGICLLILDKASVILFQMTIW